jgi:xylulose-5-phosphate/fructose-6-phosphate phosphoketolase
VANVYLEGTYTVIYPEVSRDVEGLRRLCRQFSTPGGIPSHVSVTTPGSIHEGGELGYVLTHAFDNPNLIAVAEVGDGEGETCPLEGSWKGISFLNPARDGAVLPILHLNGYKIAIPTVLGRAGDTCVRALLEGHGYEVHFVEAADPEDHARVHQAFAAVLETCYDRIRAIQQEARARRVRPAAVASDRAAYPQGLDGTKGGGRPARRGDLPRAPGAPRGGGHAAGSPRPARAVDAQLQAGGAV